MKKLVLFDLDGTLLNTIEDLGEAVNYALSQKGLPLHTMDEFPAMVGRGIRNLVKQALPEVLREDSAFVDNCLAIFKKYYSEHIDVHTCPYDGMHRLLKELHNRGVKLAVVSNKFQEGAELLVNEFFGDIPFVCVLGNREGHPLKPDPAIVKEVLDAAGIQKEDAVLVGDSVPDMLTAAGGGIDAIAVGWGYSPASVLAGHPLARTPKDLMTLLVSPAPCAR
jgi:phosphoglycolate phosphatase